MKAAVYRRYGPPDVVRIEDRPKPIPGSGELLVKVCASTLTSADWRLRRASPFLARLYNGLLRPTKAQVLGWEFAGRVEAVANDVARFKVGDEVFGCMGMRFGAHAEFLCTPENGKQFPAGFVALKPRTLPFAEAAAAPIGCLSALKFLRKGGLKTGETALINGASGSVGTYAVQIAKIIGAHVTGVCSTTNVQLVSSLGADAVIDYRTDDLNRYAGRFDVVFDAVGTLSSAVAKRLLRSGGRFVTVVSRPGNVKYDDVVPQLIEWLQAGKLRVVIDRAYPLEQIVQAHEYVEGQHKKGNVVISIE